MKLSVSIGDKVKEGDIMGVVEPTHAERDIAEAQAQVLAARAAKKRNVAQLKAAETEHERGQLSLAKMLISEKEAAQLRYQLDVLKAEADAVDAQRAQAGARVASLRERLSDTRLKAPFDGAVAERYVDPGTVVQPGTAILRLVRSGPLRVRFRVPERDLGGLARNMPLTVTTQASGDARFAGKVVRMSAEVSRINRTVAVEGLLDTTAETLRPGMYAEVSLVLGELHNAVTVPSVAIVEQLANGGTLHPGVFVVQDGQARFTALTIEGQSEDRSAVRGLSAGHAVVVLGQHALRDGAAVRFIDEDEPK
jgi:RND family efflux transporter MFP subunit